LILFDFINRFVL